MKAYKYPKKRCCKSTTLDATFTFLLSSQSALAGVNVKWRPSSHHRFYLVLQQNRIGTWDCWQNITIWPYLLFTVRLHDRCYTSKYMRKFAQLEGAHVSYRPNFAMEGQVTFRAVTIHMGILVEIQSGFPLV